MMWCSHKWWDLTPSTNITLHWCLNLQSYAHFVHSFVYNIVHGCESFQFVVCACISPMSPMFATFFMVCILLHVCMNLLDICQCSVPQIRRCPVNNITHNKHNKHNKHNNNINTIKSQYNEYMLKECQYHLGWFGSLRLYQQHNCYVCNTIDMYALPLVKLCCSFVIAPISSFHAPCTLVLSAVTVFAGACTLSLIF